MPELIVTQHPVSVKTAIGQALVLAALQAC